MQTGLGNASERLGKDPLGTTSPEASRQGAPGIGGRSEVKIDKTSLVGGVASLLKLQSVNASLERGVQNANDPDSGGKRAILAAVASLSVAVAVVSLSVAVAVVSLSVWGGWCR